MRIVFLGTGGGRFVIVNQILASGGWILEMDGEMLHIDPGPGALVRAKQYGVNLSKLTGILVSHAHPDHYSEAEMVVEAMTGGVQKKRGVLIANENVIRGGKNYHPVFSSYHLKAVERYEVLKPGRETSTGRVRVKATPTKHMEEKGIGFVFSGSKKVGYASDGSYFPGQEDYFRDCDYLIVNVLRPKQKPWPKHMDSGMAEKLIGKAKPGLAILSHFGMKMLRGIAEREAKQIQRRTGVKTIAARDGMRIESGRAGGFFHQD